ncbi:MAG: tetratricopeptide repeat protein [Gammaproteobacteria bacterium]
MDMEARKTPNAFPASNRGLTVITACVLTMLVSACATTDVKQAQVKQGAAPVQDVKAKEAAKNCASANDGEGGCGPAGIIEISEPYEVDPEVKDKFNQAINLLNGEKYQEAIKLLEEVVAKTDKFTAPYIDLGMAYARTGDMKNAEKNLEKAVEINSHHPVALNQLGLVYRKTGRYKKAQETYQAILTMYPEFLPARQNLAVLCDIYLQDLSCALNEYEEYLKRVPDDKKMKIWVADVKNRMKRQGH